jgi:hypothetical protein
MAQDEAGKLAKLIDWLRANPALPHTIKLVAIVYFLLGDSLG